MRESQATEAGQPCYEAEALTTDRNRNRVRDSQVTEPGELGYEAEALTTETETETE